MNIESKIKQELIRRGFSQETLTNNLELIRATIDEAWECKQQKQRKMKNWTLHNRDTNNGLLTFLKTRKDGSVIALIDRNGQLVPETKLIVREGSKIAKELLGEVRVRVEAPDGVQFKVETVEELEQAYKALNGRWNCYTLEEEIKFFSQGFRWIRCEEGRFALLTIPAPDLTTIPNPFK